MKKAKLHRDGSVSYYSVYSQSWRERVHHVSDEDLAAMPRNDRERVAAHIERHHEEIKLFCGHDPDNGIHVCENMNGWICRYSGPCNMDVEYLGRSNEIAAQIRALRNSD